MAEEGAEQTSKYIEALKWLGDLVSSNGLVTAVVVILAIGVAWNLPALVEQCRLLVRDFLKHKRKTKELEDRIRREANKLEVIKRGKAAATGAEKKARNER